VDVKAENETCFGDDRASAFRYPNCIVTKISAGFESACAVLTCGSGPNAISRMQCWGRNEDRNLVSELTDPMAYKSIGDDKNEIRGRVEVCFFPPV
jgi:hypothetical protein